MGGGVTRLSRIRAEIVAEVVSELVPEIVQKPRRV
jgi:hypothetical protein